MDASSLSFSNICHTKEQLSPFWDRRSQGPAQVFTSPWHSIVTLPFSAVLLLSLTHPPTPAVFLATEGAGTTPTPHLKVRKLRYKMV